MIHLLYNLILLPVLFPYLAWRLLVRGKSREGLAERFGRVPDLGPAPPSGRVWVHAVSMGETVAAAPVVAALREAMPGAEIIVSTTTPTGRKQAHSLLPEASLHFYFPVDLPWVVGRVLARLQPSALVLVEAEIWPNLLEAARRRELPVVIANGHISDRTFRRASRLRPLLSPLLAGITRYLAQSLAVRDRAISLGLPPDRVMVAGHTKFDQVVPKLSEEEALPIRAGFGLAGQPVFLAGSTHDGEEEIILEAWEAACRTVPDLALMLAPRHLERVPAVRALVERRGLTVRTRSESAAAMEPQMDADARGGTDSPRPIGVHPRSCAVSSPVFPVVYLLDTMGELARFYGLARVAFVGGSLVPRGGHDVLQPLFQGVPVLFGPHMHNQRQLSSLVLDAGAARQVGDAGALTGALVSVLRDGAERAGMTAAAARLLDQNRGASARCAAAVAALVNQGRHGGEFNGGAAKTRSSDPTVPPAILETTSPGASS